MSYDFNRSWLVNKFEEIQRRILLALDQVNDEQANWNPNSSSNSISSLILHIKGNIQERIEKGILNKEMKRERTGEFSPVFISKAELQATVKEYFDFIINTIRVLSDEKLEQKQVVRNKERSNLDMLHQCAAHYSEHMGQIFYIAKLSLGNDYVSTSIPKTLK